MIIAVSAEGDHPAAGLPYGADAVELVWHKRRWRCKNDSCPTESFTEAVEQVRPRRRTTSRLREAAAQAVAGSRSVAEVAGRASAGLGHGAGVRGRTG